MDCYWCVLCLRVPLPRGRYGVPHARVPIPPPTPPPSPGTCREEHRKGEQGGLKRGGGERGGQGRARERARRDGRGGVHGIEGNTRRRNSPVTFPFGAAAPKASGTAGSRPRGRRDSLQHRSEDNTPHRSLPVRLRYRSLSPPVCHVPLRHSRSRPPRMSRTTLYIRTSESVTAKRVGVWERRSRKRSESREERRLPFFSPPQERRSVRPVLLLFPLPSFPTPSLPTRGEEAGGSGIMSMIHTNCTMK